MNLFVLKHGNDIIGVYTTIENAAAAICGPDREQFHRFCAYFEQVGEYGPYSLRIGVLDAPTTAGWKKFDILDT